MRQVCQRVAERRPRRIVDLGCGEGIVARELALCLREPFEYLGLDANPGSVETARDLNRDHPNLCFEVADVVSLQPRKGWADVGICLEVLEHLPQPERAVDRLALWSRDVAIFSVPWEPWFQLGNLARGRHVLRLGNHPEHIQHFGPRSFGRLLGRSRGRVSVETCFPWLVGTVDLKEYG